MENSIGTGGFMAVFAVSGSVVLLSVQVHKRLLSNFMKKMEFELLGIGKSQGKKVRFAEDIVVVDKKECEKKVVSRSVVTIAGGSEGVDRNWEKTMPLNWQVLYKGILDSRKSTNGKRKRC